MVQASRYFRPLVVLLMLAGVRAVFATNPSAERQNILFIAVDDLRPELGCYGDQAITPNIDRLAASGLRFDRAFCNQAVCGASRTSLMTGLYPELTGLRSYHVQGWRDKLADVTTLNQHLKNHGYLTLGLGKIYHERVGHEAVDGDNWDRWFEPSHDTHWLASENIAMHRRNEHRFQQTGEGPKRGPVTESLDVEDNAYIDGQRADLAVQLIDQLSGKSKSAVGAPLDAATLDANRPFFLAVGFSKPHLPFVAPQKYWDLYRRDDFAMPRNAGIPPGYPRGAARLDPGEIKHYAGIPTRKAPPAWDDALNLRLLHGYHACVSYTDAHIGRLLDALDEHGLADTTIVILWGDHGWKLGDHSSWCKHTNFEVDTRVPLVIRHPGIKPSSGKSSSSLVELIDLYPTICEFVGIPTPSHLQGRSLVPVLHDPATEVRRTAYSSYPARVDRAGTIGHSIRTTDYRYTEWWSQNDEMKVVASVATDLSTDPGETTSLPEDSPLLKALSRQLHDRVMAARRKAQSQSLVK